MQNYKQSCLWQNIGQKMPQVDEKWTLGQRNMPGSCFPVGGDENVGPSICVTENNSFWPTRI